VSEQEDIALFSKLIDENRYDFVKLAYLVFPFGEKGHALEHMNPYRWQIEEMNKISAHLKNPTTRYDAYRLIISSGNGAAKTAFGSMMLMLLMYTQRLRCRITANTDPQLRSIVWPEVDRWFRHARFHDHFFEKFGTSIKAKNDKLSEGWRTDLVTWDEQRPASISGLHNKGGAILYIFEESSSIPAVIWQYASGAFTETDTIKLFFAFANSDDPESKFEQNMNSPLWHSRRIDTRTLDHIDQNQIQDWLQECGGNEDHDDFRTRVRGLPRKTSKDSIISLENVQAAMSRAKGFDVTSVSMLPVILTCDAAWTGGDETCIAYRQGNYSCLLEKYKLDKAAGETHQLTFAKLCHWEKELRADAVFIDQGEGSAIYTLATNSGRTSWVLISFANSPNDKPEAKESEYANIRAQMFYEFNTFLMKGGILDAKDPSWIDGLTKQLCWTKGGRHKITNKKKCESKLEIKARVGQSPDIADAFVLTMAMPVTERLPENSIGGGEDRVTGSEAWIMPSHDDPYKDLEDVTYRNLYD
jgi:hypothetical protein